jgi:hypothetical protein
MRLDFRRTFGVSIYDTLYCWNELPWIRLATTSWPDAIAAPQI